MIVTGAAALALYRLIAAPTTGTGSGSSQTPAIMALIIAGISGFATLYSIYRQNRNDRVANAAVHSSAANEAAKQSFEQMMKMSEYQARQIAELQRRIDDLEEQMQTMERDLASERREASRLRSMVIQLGGTP